MSPNKAQQPLIVPNRPNWAALAPLAFAPMASRIRSKQPGPEALLSRASRREHFGYLKEGISPNPTIYIYMYRCRYT